VPKDFAVEDSPLTDIIYVADKTILFLRYGQDSSLDSDVWQNISNVQIILMSEQLINYAAYWQLYIRQSRAY